MKYDASLPPADGKPYYWAATEGWTEAPTADGHDECFGIHNGTEGPVDCDGRPI